MLIITSRLKRATNKSRNVILPLIKVRVWICTHIKLFSLTIIYLSFISNVYSGNRGGRCQEELEDHHILTGPCNSIEEGLVLCIHVLESKQRKILTCCLSWVPWETFKSTEEITGWCPNWRWFDQVLLYNELCNLQICADIWWCTRDHFGGPQ